MTDTPLEKAARAVLACDAECDDYWNRTIGQVVGDPETAAYIVRAVLLAVREPDLGMRQICDFRTAEEWPVVIDHILRGGETQPPNDGEPG